MSKKDPAFSNKHIDDIDIDMSFNFFSPVWDELYSKNIKIEKMLDVGCGNGLFTIYAKNKFKCNVAGIDGNQYALGLAKENGFDDVHFIDNFDADQFPFKNDSYDFVLCKDLLEHLLNPEFVLSEIHRVTVVGGYVLLSVPNHFPLAGRLKFLFNNNIDTFNYFPDSKRWNFPHIRFFTFDSFVDMIKLYGFEICNDLSHHFGVVPFGRVVPFKSMLAKKDPNNFSEAFTLLIRKVS